MINRLRISLVIPAYNEESHLASCLEAIACQSVQPFEVIVVDNNSSDQTVAIARRYPFVRVITETRQGVVFARDTGFNAARGDIIGRTDADGILAPDWVERVLQVFSDPAVEAASGIVSYRDIGLKRIFGAVDTRIRHYMASHMAAIDECFLYGVNMAIRTSAWNKVRHDVCHERHLHEDLDLAVHMIDRSRNVVFAPSMQASIAPRQAAASPREFLAYVWSSPRVYAEHRMLSQRYMYPVAAVLSGLYVPIYLLYKGFNPETQHFSLRYMFQNMQSARVSPVSESI